MKASGYPDLSKIAGTEFTVHPPDRPSAKRIVSALFSGSIPDSSDAEILFGGSFRDQFAHSQWSVKNGSIIAGKGGLAAKRAYGGMHHHY